MDYGLVLGAPRSGTTFLMRALDALPDTECVTGNLLPVAIPHLWNRELSEEARETLLGAFEKSLRDYLESGAYNARAAALAKWAAARGGLLRAARGERREARLVYKEPFLAFAPDYAYEALPGARLVYLVRDGRDVADSLVRSYDVFTDEKLVRLDTSEAPIGRLRGDRYVPWWVEEGADEEFLAAVPYVRAIWMWMEMVHRCDEFFSRPEVVASGRVLQVRYEELVGDPVGVGSRIVGHLGTDMNRRVKARLREAHAGSVGVHRGRDRAEIAEAERVAGAELALLGY